MFHRLLIPTDGSDQLTAMLPLVRHLAARAGASVVLVCAASPIVNRADLVDNRKAVAAHGEKVARLEEAVEALQRDGIEATYVVEFRRAEHAIAVAAKHHEADLIVMTPHAREGFAAILHPSVTASVLPTAPAPLLVVPERAATLARAGLLTAPESTVVAPLDGSKLAERALPFAVALAQEYQRGLQLVRVVSPPRDSSAYADAYERPQPRFQGAVREARRYLSALEAATTEATGLPVEIEVSVGESAREIMDIAEEYPTNLIVMSTHGHGALARILMGSVATSVMWRSSVPVLIVPPHARAPQRAATTPGRAQAGARG